MGLVIGWVEVVWCVCIGMVAGDSGKRISTAAQCCRIV